MFFLASSKHRVIEWISHILVDIILCKQSILAVQDVQNLLKNVFHCDG